VWFLQIIVASVKTPILQIHVKKKLQIGIAFFLKEFSVISPLDHE
jgi:hypothetical protein